MGEVIAQSSLKLLLGLTVLILVKGFPGYLVWTCLINITCYVNDADYNEELTESLSSYIPYIILALEVRETNLICGSCLLILQ